jgi:hypothetical protein
MYATQTPPVLASHIGNMPARDTMPVERAMGQLDDSLARLNTVIESLLPRLAAVSRPAVDGSTVGRERAPAECMLVDQITSSAIYADHLAEVLIAARDRLCI